MRVWVLLFFTGLQLCRAQQPVRDRSDVERVGPGVKAPGLLNKIEPEFSAEARAAHIQGTAVFDIVVDEQGLPTDIQSVSPIGFGLDEKARAAIEKWRFRPGTREGKPVKIAAMIEVNFRFKDSWFDEAYEQRRTAFNRAVRDLSGSNAAAVTQAIESIQRLSRQNFTPALFLEATLIKDGKIRTDDPTRFRSLVVKSAEKNYGPAMFELGKMYRDGDGVPRDEPKAAKLFADAAVLGSTAAQHYLGTRYELGDGVAADPERARRYYRLCAAAGEPSCQVLLARSLLAMQPRAEHYYIQAVAWLALAAEKGFAPAEPLLGREQARMTPDQNNWVARVKTQLVPKR